MKNNKLVRELVPVIALLLFIIVIPSLSSLKYSF